MVGWLGFVAKLVEYVAKKILDKSLDPASPCRKDACLTFVRLFHSLVGIEYLTRSMLQAMDADGDDSFVSLSRWTESHANELDVASGEFLAAAAEVTRVTAMYDPELATLLGNLVRGKNRIARVATFPLLADSFVFGLDDSGALTMSEASEDLLLVDLDQYYRALKDETLKLPSEEWPEGVIGTLIKTHMAQVRITNDQDAVLQQVVDRIGQHVNSLAKARLALAAFIRTEFSIEDLLFVTK